MRYSEPKVLEVRRYKHWEIELTETTIYKGSRNFKFPSYGYRYYSGDDLKTSFGVHFLTPEVAFEKCKRGIDVLLNMNSVKKPNKSMKGESMGFGKAQKALDEQKEAAKGDASTATTKRKRQKVSEEAKSDNKTAGNKPSGKRSTPGSQKEKATKAAKAPTTKAPSGKGKDVQKPKNENNNVKGEVKMSKAVTKAEKAVERQEKAVATAQAKVDGIRLEISAVTATRKHTVDQGIVLLGAYNTGITAITTLSSEGEEVSKDVIAAITALPAALKKSTADEAKQVKLLSGAIEKLDAAKEKLGELQDELKEVIESEKNAD